MVSNPESGDDTSELPHQRTPENPCPDLKTNKDSTEPSLENQLPTDHPTSIPSPKELQEQHPRYRDEPAPPRAGIWHKVVRKPTPGPASAETPSIIQTHYHIETAQHATLHDGTVYEVPITSSSMTVVHTFYSQSLTRGTLVTSRTIPDNPFPLL